MRAFTSTSIVAALVAFASASPLVIPSPYTKHDAALRRAADCGEVGSDQYCEGTKRSDNAAYLCGDERLGPSFLTSMSPLDRILRSWDRFGDLCPGEFLAKWNPNGRWKYPDHNGFDLNAAGQPIEKQEVLDVGTLVDRFGSEGGKYLAPAGTYYTARAIPPSNLNTVDKSAPFNYYQYEVLKPLPVLAGPVRPWFEQKGKSTQYQVEKRVSELINEGYLARKETCCINCTRNSCHDFFSSK
ncbi:hypothetical protein HGRIS_008766 [Hohenbuehelia grisea]|uniref:TNT domain-containing protein n=1 Tax=Hohenbuehelia grisea TaxID=104357 RepID=A0ABR3J921_9AGAR